MPDPIPCVSLWQPWASLWVAGAKRIETRSWPLYGRLPRTLAVHASKRWDRDLRALCLREPFRSALAALGSQRPDDLPRGCVVGVVTAVRVYRFDGSVPPEPERSFGDYAVGRYGWVTEGNRLLAEPVPAKGMQGVFGWMPPAALYFAEGMPIVASAPPRDDGQGLLFAAATGGGHA